MSDLPGGWRHTTLGELAAPEQGAITDGPFGSNLTSAHYTDSGARVIRLENIGDGYFRDARSFVALEHFLALRKHEARSGDLVVASLGDNLPRACLIPDLGVPALVKADCIRIRLGRSVHPKYVLYALQAPLAKTWAHDRLRGVGRMRLGLKGIRDIPIAVPSLGEQNRIVAMLDSHLSGLDAARAYLLAATRRTESWERLTADAAVEAASGATCAVGDVVERIEAGRSFGGSAPPAQEGEWGVIRVSAMTWGEFRPQENKAVPAEAANPRYEIRPGDLLVSRANTTGYVGAPVLVGETRPRLLLSDKSLRLVPKPGVEAAWLVQALASRQVRRQISASATGTKDSMRNISQANLAAVRIPAPPEDQSRVIEQTSAIRQSAERLRGSLIRERERTYALRGSVLTAAFSGQL